MKLYEFARHTLEEAFAAFIPQASSDSAGEDGSLCRAAVIGFAGDSIRGTLGIAVSYEGLQRTSKRSGALTDPEACLRSQQEDGLAELSNLLLGAVRRAWLRRGIQVTMSTPLVLRGLSIEVCGSEGPEWVAVESSCGTDRITAWLDVHSDDDLDVPDEDVVGDVIPTGEALLF